MLKDQVMNNNSDGELETQKPVVPIVPEGVVSSKRRMRIENSFLCVGGRLLWTAAWPPD